MPFRKLIPPFTLTASKPRLHTQANTPLSQSERAYFLSYFIINKSTTTFHGLYSFFLLLFARIRLVMVNKNALSSYESRLLGDEFCCQGPGAVILLFRLEYKTSVVCHNVYTQKVKIARRDRPHILASNRCETFENLLHIDIAPLRSTLSGILHSKN